MQEQQTLFFQFKASAALQHPATGVKHECAVTTVNSWRNREENNSLRIQVHTTVHFQSVLPYCTGTANPS